MSNLKMVKNHRQGFLFAVESNRRVSVAKGRWVQGQQLDILPEGRLVWLREFGEVKLFRTRLKGRLRHYVVFLPSTGSDPYPSFGRRAFEKLHDQHGRIEQYHRLIKQVCHIERFQVRGKVPILNHIFAALAPAILLKIVLYAYACGIITSRRIAKACRENMIFMALAAGAQPPFTTLAHLVSSMHKEIKPVFLEVLLNCEEQGLLGHESLALDGCKLSRRAGIPQPQEQHRLATFHAAW